MWTATDSEMGAHINFLLYWINNSASYESFGIFWKNTKFDKNLHISFVTQYYGTCITIAI